MKNEEFKLSLFEESVNAAIIKYECLKLNVSKRFQRM